MADDMDTVSGKNGIHAAREFFASPMYFAEITGWPPDELHTFGPVKSSGDARFTMHVTNPAEDEAIPHADPATALFVTSSFSLVASGNRTLRTPKRSWDVHLLEAGDQPKNITGLSLKAMYNDPSQMREALAWQLLGGIGVPASRHTYVKFAINGVYRGLFSLVEPVDKRFLKDHFGDNHHGNLYKADRGDIGYATLEHRAGPDGDDSGRQYFTADDDRTYRLKTNSNDHGASSYDDLAQFIRTINGTGLGSGEERFDTDAFRESVDHIMNARAFLRWAAVNLLLGSWDNYYATPANYYLYNSGRRGAEEDFMHSPYFTFIPWNYDNCLGIDYFGTQWQYTDILDWPSNTRNYWRGHATSCIPLVQNLLRNHDYCQYYLNHLEHLLDTVFTVDVMAHGIGIDGGGLWERISRAAYLESDTPHSQPFTGRQFTNDEVYRAGFKQHQITKGQAKIEGIVYYARMRYDSARIQLEQLRNVYPRGDSGATFAGAMEPLPERT